MSEKTLTLGVLVSGRGTNLQALIDARYERKLAATVGVVISNKPDSRAIERSRKAGIPAFVIEPQAGESREDYDKKLINCLNEHKVDLVVLAGFMRILSPSFIKAFPTKVINIHPSLLPSFPGRYAQKDALEYGVKFAGCTVHFADEGCDTGPIIMQSVVPIDAGETPESLADKILLEEHQLLPKAVDLVARGKVTVKGRQVIIS
ncbi:phosphoribosylglycinamide formyltransferase [bacterium]|nr:phosphoribosylglycinamide formyltransferase [bacterium]